MPITGKFRKELFFELVLSFSAIIGISLFYLNNTLLTILMLFGWFLGNRLWHTKHDTYFFVIAAILGSAAEIIAIHFGAWKYSNPTFLGIPIWLPLAWGFAVLVIKRIAETFIKIEMK